MTTAAPFPGPSPSAPAAVYGPASDLLLPLYGMRLNGDRAPVKELITRPSPA
ncbi:MULTISPECIES: hypothetical protein [Streptomyces]|uniref:hypothetical protein n=1 Tax=Streptomyces TaxID=1883 RepID=UPI001559FF56|nr:hypothetical protein [Streptomyces kasugaensis]